MEDNNTYNSAVNKLSNVRFYPGNIEEYKEAISGLKNAVSELKRKLPTNSILSMIKRVEIFASNQNIKKWKEHQGVLQQSGKES